MTTTSKALAALELRTAAAVKCDWCRVFAEANHLSYTPAQNSDESLEVVCRWCGWRVVYSVANEGPPERETLRLIFCSGAEEKFTDVRVYASALWFPHRTRARKYLASYRKSAADVAAIKDGTFKPPRTSIRPARDKMPQSKAERLAAQEKADRQALKERAWAFQRRMLAEEKKRFGPHRFSLHAEVKAIESEAVPSAIFPGDRVGNLARLALKDFRIVELCEVALWGAALPETADALGELRPVVEALEEEEREKKEKREREQRESEERFRRRREEERALVLERTGAPSVSAAMGVTPRVNASPPQEAPGSWLDTYQPPAEKESKDLTREAARMVREEYDPTHPDAVQLQRSTPPQWNDPTQGLKTGDLAAEVRRSRAEADAARTGDRREHWFLPDGLK